MPANTKLNKPSAVLGAPEAPAGFAPADKTLWKAVVASRPVSTWTASDLRCLRLYVEAHSDVERLTREIDRHGEVLAGKINPAVKVRAMREQFLVSLGMKLKLMPSNRWDPKGVHRMGEHARKAQGAAAMLDSDDLLGGTLQ